MTMMAYPLTITSMFRRGIDLFPRKHIVTRRPSGELVRHSYREFGERTARLADALRGLGVERGDRVGTFATLAKEDFERTLAVNLTGVFLCAKHAFRAMQWRRAGGGVGAAGE